MSHKQTESQTCCSSEPLGQRNLRPDAYPWVQPNSRPRGSHYSHVVGPVDARPRQYCIVFDHFFSFPRSPHANATLHEKKLYSGKCCERSLHRESISFMKGVMDECTHMANFSGKFSIEGRIKCIFIIMGGTLYKEKQHIMSAGDAKVHPKYNRTDWING